MILIKIQKNIDFHSEIEELRHKIRITVFHLTSQISWRLCRIRVITSPRSKYMISGYQSGVG